MWEDVDMKTLCKGIRHLYSCQAEMSSKPELLEVGHWAQNKEYN